MLLSLIPALLITLWCSLVYGFITAPNSKVLSSIDKQSVSFSLTISHYFKHHLEKYSIEAASIGVSWRIGNTIILWIISLVLSIILFRLTNNWLIFIAAWFFVGILPNQFIKSIYQKQRLAMLEGLVDCLRQIIARIPDQGSLIRALELSVKGNLMPGIEELLLQVIQDISLGTSIEEALNNWRKQVKLRKFDSVIDILLQAHYEGWTEVALKALDKAVQAMESDLRAIQLAKQKSWQRKRQLYQTILTAWSFPLILSLLDSGKKNIFLSTIIGKLLILAYIVSTLFVIFKGNEYLALNVDEL